MYRLKIYLTLPTLIFVFAMSGQSDGFSIGAEGGAGQSDLRGYDSRKYQHPRLGYTAGMFMQCDFNNYISMRIGGYYELKGTGYEFESFDKSGNSLGVTHCSLDFDYFTVPLLFRAGIGKRLRGFLNAGPYMAMLLKQTQTIGPEKDDNTQYFKRTDYGVSAGIGVCYTVKKLVFSLEARNNLGLFNTSLLHSKLDGQSVKTNAVNLLIGVSFKLGKSNEPKVKSQVNTK